MRVAVTGASGFIGGYVLRELRTHDVMVVPISRTTKTATEWVTLDVSAPPDNPYEAMGRPDVLIHLAWGGLPNYQSSYHVDTELPAHVAFLSSCVEHGLQRLVVTGTCYEYGLGSGELAEDTPAQPCTQYGLAKDLLHQRLRQLNNKFELTWLRLFYLYGEGQSERSLYSMLHAAINRGDKSFDMSGGDQLRDFLPVAEVARLIVNVALHKQAHGVFNICRGKPVSVRQLVQSWIDQTGSDIRMNLGRMPYSSVEPMAFWGNRRALNATLGINRTAQT